MQQQQEQAMHHSAQKECACVTHQGPHWLYMDYIARQQNLETLRMARDLYRDGNLRDGARYSYEYKLAEMRRMDEKVRYMSPSEQYSYSLLGDVNDVQALVLSIHQEIQNAIWQQINKANEVKDSR